MLVALLVPIMPLLVVRKALMVSKVVFAVRVSMPMSELCLKGASMVERLRHHRVHLDQMRHCIIY